MDGGNVPQWWEMEKFDEGLRKGGEVGWGTVGEDYQLVGIWGGVILPIWTFFKAKSNICKYWTLNKIKISMTCVHKEYEVKINMVKEQGLQLKMKFLLSCNMKIVVYWGE